MLMATLLETQHITPLAKFVKGNLIQISLSQVLSKSLTYSLTHSLTHLIIHSLTHSLTHLLACRKNKLCMLIENKI